MTTPMVLLRNTFTIASRNFTAFVKRTVVTMNGINDKHLVAGSQCPPMDPKKVTLINMRLCPYAQRAALVLIAKEIP